MCMFKIDISKLTCARKMKIETEIMFNVHAQYWQWYECLLEKCYEYEMFLVELGKFWHKFQVNRVSKTHDMAKMVNLTHFWTVYENDKITCRRRVQMKLWYKWKL